MRTRTLTGWLVALALVLGTAHAADDRTARLTLTTSGDDMRAGGTATFVLVMKDGREQTIPLTHGEALPEGRTSNHMVGPSAPYQWRDVAKFGVRARLHPGDGALLQADKWRATFTLTGSRDCDDMRHVEPGHACFVSRGGTFTWEREQTQLIDFSARLGQCRQDYDCADAGANFCSARRSVCVAGRSGGDAMGCKRVSTPVPACSATENCDATAKRCIVRGCENPDADGDGENSIACGGADCDDNDNTRAPQRTEVCDDKGKDEDCNPVTYGKRDADRDGFNDALCFNDG